MAHLCELSGRISPGASGHSLLGSTHPSTMPVGCGLVGRLWVSGALDLGLLRHASPAVSQRSPLTTLNAHPGFSYSRCSCSARATTCTELISAVDTIAARLRSTRISGSSSRPRHCYRGEYGHVDHDDCLQRGDRPCWRAMDAAMDRRSPRSLWLRSCDPECGLNAARKQQKIGRVPSLHPALHPRNGQDRASRRCWLHEPKLDGYRVQVAANRAPLQPSGHHWSKRLAVLVEALQA